jgi:hypothetical protein
MVTIGPGDLYRSIRPKTPGSSYSNKETMEGIELIAKKANARNQAVIVPIWNKLNASMPELCNWQREQLISRGIRGFYDSELEHLAEYYQGLKQHLREPS